MDRSLDFEAIGWLLLQMFGAVAGIVIILLLSLLVAILVAGFFQRILSWIMDG